MFVALELVEQNNSGIFRSLFSILRKPKAELTMRSVGGTQFAIIRAPVGRTGPDWDEIAYLAGFYSDQMLLPDGCTPPEGCDIHPVDCRRHRAVVMAANACEIIRRTRMPMYRRMAGLIDLEGLHPDILFPLLHHYTTVHIITENTHAYEEAAEYVMDKLGAPVLIGSDLSALDNCALVLSPEPLVDREAAVIPCPVLATTPFSPAARTLFTDIQVHVSDELRQVCPNGISPHRFSSAIYDCCDTQDNTFLADKLFYNSQYVDLPIVIGEVMRCAGVENQI